MPSKDKQHVEISPDYGVGYCIGAQINTGLAGVEVAPTTTVFSFNAINAALAAYNPKYIYVSIYENA